MKLEKIGRIPFIHLLIQHKLELSQVSKYTQIILSKLGLSVMIKWKFFGTCQMFLHNDVLYTNPKSLDVNNYPSIVICELNVKPIIINSLTKLLWSGKDTTQSVF